MAVFELHQPGLDRLGRKVQREQQLAAGHGAGRARFQNMPREEERKLLFSRFKGPLQRRGLLDGAGDVQREADERGAASFFQHGALLLRALFAPQQHLLHRNGGCGKYLSAIHADPPAR